ncbi:MAG: GNAT family N-acetyltransferase [Pseudomonadota bacterium]
MNVLHPSPLVRALYPDEWATYRDLRLRSLADSPDAFYSTLESEGARSPEDWAARLATAAVSGKDCPLVAELDGKPAGLVWAKMDAINPALVHLYQMWVAPECRGCGVAQRLLDTALSWVRERGARFVELDVTVGNSAAARLYQRAGFRAVNAPAPMRAGSDLMLQPMRLVLED